MYEGIDPQWRSECTSNAEINFAEMWDAYFPEIDLYTQEENVIPDRKFSFDFVHRPSKTAIEVQGFGPGHHSIQGIKRDQEKILLASIEGWLVLQISSDEIEDAKTIFLIKNVLETRCKQLRAKL